ncbi:MAG: hypothetical protein SOY99_03960 [Alloprevotella sp.]|nr:hypothetical protein [Bacteroidales bacterium]MDY3943367.1 hypothetical protein [Alloprevotella sp.]
MKIIGIYRAPRFSPNSVERDAAILNAVIETFKEKGHEVECFEEDNISESHFNNVEAIFSMARDTVNLERLASWTKSCSYFPNRPQALLQASRTFLTQLMAALGIPQPKFEQINTSPPTLPLPFWLKRGDCCAQEKGDVCFIQTKTELEATLNSFAKRQVTDILAFAHEKGDLVKFYGVAGTDFFHISHPTDTAQFSKFGLESHNSQLNHYRFNQASLHKTATALATASGLIIYGGDAIIRPDGSFAVIDFNDWPSFSACRNKAAQAIASLIHIERKS